VEKLAAKACGDGLRRDLEVRRKIELSRSVRKCIDISFII
jgi:hypothetical protein